MYYHARGVSWAMSRYDNIVRVVRFLDRLEESRAGITVKAAANELRVSERTARRYIQALRNAGYDIEGEDGRYRLARRQGALDRLTEADRRRLVMAAIASWPLRGTPLVHDPAALDQQLFASPRQRDLFARLKVPLAPPHRLAIDYRRYGGVLQNLVKAIDERKVVEAEYFTASRNEWTSRRIHPYTFYFDGSLEALYLFAYCEWRKEVRTFAAHRFRLARPTRSNFAPNPTFSVESHLANAFRVYRGKNAIEVVLRFTPAVAPRVGERRWHASQRERRLSDGGLELTFTVDGDEELRSFVLSFGPDVRVIAPASIVDRIAADAAAVAAQYARRPSRRAEVVGEDETRKPAAARNLDQR